VESPSRLNQHTPQVTKKQARFDAKQARASAMTKLGFDVDQPKKFTIDEDIPDPMPNEPWFHARYEQTPGAKFHFDSDRPAFFTREDWAAESIARDKGFYTETKGEHFVGFMGAEIADDIDLREHVEDGIKIFVSNLQMKKTIGFEDFVGELEVWRKKVGTKKAISSVLSSIPSENLDLLGIGKISTWDDLIRVILNEDMLYSSSLRTHLKSKGYDSALFAAGNMLSDEYSSIAVVFDPKQIKTPGTKGTKTDTGIEWGIASEVEKSLKKRTSDLRTAKIKNEVETQRRKWKKEQADIEAARTKPKAEPEDPDALYRRPDSVEAIEHDRTVIDQEIMELEEELLGKVPEAEGEPVALRGEEEAFPELKRFREKLKGRKLFHVTEADPAVIAKEGFQNEFNYFSLDEPVWEDLGRNVIELDADTVIGRIFMDPEGILGNPNKFRKKGNEGFYSFGGLEREHIPETFKDFAEQFDDPNFEDPLSVVVEGKITPDELAGRVAKAEPVALRVEEGGEIEIVQAETIEGPEGKAAQKAIDEGAPNQLAARIGDKTVAKATVSFDGESLTLDSITSRQKGAGSALLLEVLEQADKEKVPFNAFVLEDSKVFYEKSGLEVVNERISADSKQIKEAIRKLKEKAKPAEVDTGFTAKEQAVFDEVAADFNNLEARENSIKAGINCIGGKL